MEREKKVRISYDLMYFGVKEFFENIFTLDTIVAKRKQFLFQYLLKLLFRLNEWCCMNSKVCNDNKLLIFTIDNGAI